VEDRCVVCGAGYIPASGDPGAGSGRCAACDRPEGRDIAALLPPGLAQRYEIHSQIGSGGMGIVLRARDRELDRPVAIKLIHPDLTDGQGLARFGREMLYLAKIEHPNIVRLYDAQVRGSMPYLVMELLEGTSLSSLMAAGPVSEARARRILLEVLDGLACIHAHGLLHRDLKPSNIFLRGDRPVLIDFGLVRAVDVTTMVTPVGNVVGTPRYMAPELVLSGEPTFQSDLFALGMVGVELVTGLSLFETSESEKLQSSHLVYSSLGSGTYFQVATRMLAERGQLGRVLLRSLTPEKTERFGTAQEMHEALSQVITGRSRTARPVRSLRTGVDPTIVAPEPAWAPPATSSVFRRNIYQILAIGTSLALLLCLVVASLERPKARVGPPPPSPSPAQLAQDTHTRLPALAKVGERDCTAALDRYRKAALSPEPLPAGDVEAISKIGHRFLEGDGLRRDPVTARRWFELSARHSHADSQWHMGLFCYSGVGNPRDRGEAVRWFQKGAAQGHSGSQTQLGFAYVTGEGVARDPVEGMRWYKKAAEQGNADAQASVGDLYRAGDGVTRDIREAIRWYRVAAANGSGVGFMNLASLYAKGQGVKRDLKLALRHYLNAARKEHSWSAEDIALLTGSEVAGDAEVQSAFVELRKAERAGNSAAINNLACLQLVGILVSKDLQAALTGFTRAAGLENSVACANLGAFYLAGDPTAANDRKALVWLQKAAEDDDASAQFRLAQLYESGRAAPKDPQVAKMWYVKAALRGFERARDKIAASEGLR
jgi:TPR repeat protein/serine/threonine protein kinase